ncbi:MAG TPA: hypothetical protein VIG73_08370 [Cerasibacillus sp.]|uniref:hypothetical protein n=1 Tax=Cerasibacillus sp. TaxID=2498711 RepID=UPI002F42EF0B
MKRYYYNINVDEKGNHEVHHESCTHLPSRSNREYIGYVSDCETAIELAIRNTGKTNFDGCYWCSRECHNG